MSMSRVASALLASVLLCALAGGAVWGEGGTLPSPVPTSGPTIEWFTCECEVGNLWTFYGRVQDYDGATEVTIVFSNLPSLQGKTVQVNSDGTFALTITLGVGETGLVIAEAVDDLGEVSEPVETLVL
jgi:hypothetical protein